VDLDAAPAVGGTGAGPQPLQLLLVGLAGCTGMDVISILRKKRQQVSALVVEVTGQRAADHPRVYTTIEIVYRVRGMHLDPQAVARAIELSETRYCPAIAMLGATATITSRFDITDDAS
jgi:putative redox protein